MIKLVEFTRVRCSSLEVALEALLTRVRWYVLRGHRVPAETALAFNEIADLLDKPNTDPWRRVV